MPPLSEAEEDALSHQILDQLAQTPYACSTLTKLSGGTANFLYRGVLLQPLEDAQTVVIKHSTGFAAVNRGFPLDVSRCVFEESMLHALDGLCRNVITPSGLAVVTAPRCYMFDRDTHTQVHQDFPHTTDLTTLLQSPKGDQILPGSSSQAVGYALGSWLRFFHNWTSEPAQAELRRRVGSNEGMRRLKCLITYDSFIEILARHPETLEGYRETLEAVRSAMKYEFERGPTESDEIRGLIHGDFWTGNVLLPDRPWQGTQPAQDPNELFVIDWENVQFGHRAVDIGGMLADLYERSHFKDVAVSIPLMRGFVEGYGPLSEELAFGTAVHAGVHLICWYYRRDRSAPLPYPLPKFLDALALGRDFVVRGWAKDREWFEGSVLAPLFMYEKRSHSNLLSRNGESASDLPQII
ncbi:kinase-like domain-containing protein [Trichoderma novae-zelandiae]